MAKKELTTSAFTRMVKLGGLVSRVGISMATNTITNAFRSIELKDMHRSLNLTKNATRIANTLGSLKGVPMKIGQMISLHERFLPPEVTSILRSLQQKAPSVPFDDILDMMKTELGDRFQQIFRIEDNAYAAASIGQVHRAELRDGTQVVFKVQYPGIDKVIAADMRNLKGLLKMIFSMLTQMDTETVWEELNDRLTEELDYLKEAENMVRMKLMYRNNPDVVIPDVILNLSSRHILCMIFTEGLSAEEACSEDYPQSLRDQWAQHIVNNLMNDFFISRFLHVDPNLANFSFCTDGRIIIYDFGCMKTIPEKLAIGYARLAKAVLLKNYDSIPALLKAIEVHKINGDLLPVSMIAEYADVFSEPFREYPPYRFGNDQWIYERLIDLGQKYFQELMTLTFPKDVVFLDRTIAGHFANIGKLEATGDWHHMLLKCIEKILV
ncbi:MAG: AarF/ABC1/UbiB kinase family protein [Desulfobacterales bacterium]|nr:AarF/ABC1/UbiB kinase family protein [Desulfobacterales bacterium]